MKLQKKYKEEGLSIIGMSMDFGSIATLYKFIDHFSINYPVLMASSEVIYLYGGVRSIPTGFLVNRKGHVIKMYQGGTSYSTYERDIKQLL